MLHNSVFLKTNTRVAFFEMTHRFSSECNVCSLHVCNVMTSLEVKHDRSQAKHRISCCQLSKLSNVSNSRSSSKTRSKAFTRQEPIHASCQKVMIRKYALKLLKKNSDIQTIKNASTEPEWRRYVVWVEKRLAGGRVRLALVAEHLKSLKKTPDKFPHLWIAKGVFHLLDVVNPFVFR